MPYNLSQYEIYSRMPLNKKLHNEILNNAQNCTTKCTLRVAQ